MSSTAGVRTFYAEKNILITGATGFLGICLLEKILRTIPEHGDIYLLLRPKKGQDINARLEILKSNQIFEVLLRDKSAEEVFSRVKAVAGDVSEYNLDLSGDDRKLLSDNINVIFHLAATLDFGETLTRSVDVNLLGTKRIIEMAKECTYFSALIHVSSTYVNSFQYVADETIYPLEFEGDEFIRSVKSLSPQELYQQTPQLLGKHLNPYTITKHMAELQVQRVENLFPCAIVRPSMIIGAWKEPVPGWTISRNGPQGFLLGAAKGVIRRLPVGEDFIYDYIPVDIVVNSLLSAGFYVGMMEPKEVCVFHCTTSTRNPFRWRMVADKINNYLHMYPLKTAVWYPHLKLLPSSMWFKISTIFVHLFPALLLDTVTLLVGGRPVLLKLHRNVFISLGRLERFIFTEWKFPAKKIMDLQEWLNEDDKVDFNVDVSSLVWEDYFSDLALGTRIYLSKDPISTLPAAKKRDKILLVVHLIWQFLIFLLIWYIFSCLMDLTMSACVFIVPICYMLYNLL